MLNNSDVSGLVSCCIPAYNHEGFIAETILSFINQDYQNLELIIINDGSLDSTHDVILSLESRCKTRFRRFIYLNRENRGVCSTMNQLIELAHGEYIAFSASDDISYPQRISELLHGYEFLGDSYCAVFGDAGFIDANSHEVALGLNGELCNSDRFAFSSALRFNCRHSKEDFKNGLHVTYGAVLQDNFIPGISFLYRKKYLLEVGGYTEGVCIEDWDLYLKLLKKYKFHFLDKKLSAYRLHGNNAVVKMRFKLVKDSFALLLREEAFSKKCNFAEEWKTSYFNNLLRLIKLNKWKDFVVYFRWDVSFFRKLLVRFLTRFRRSVALRDLW